MHAACAHGVCAAYPLRHGENETDISTGSAAGARGHPQRELLYLISHGGRTLIKRPEINNMERRAVHVSLGPLSSPPNRSISVPRTCNTKASVK